MKRWRDKPSEQQGGLPLTKGGKSKGQGLERLNKMGRQQVQGVRASKSHCPFPTAGASPLKNCVVKDRKGASGAEFNSMPPVLEQLSHLASRFG